MDLDVVHRHVKELRDWKAKVEQLLSSGTLDRLIALSHAELPGDPGELKAHVAELAETVTGLQQTLEKLPETISASLQEALKPLEAKLAAVDKLADAAVLDLLDWLAGNREAIDVLLSLGETTDADGGDKAPGEGAGSEQGKEAPAGSGAQPGS